MTVELRGNVWSTIKGLKTSLPSQAITHLRTEEDLEVIINNQSKNILTADVRILLCPKC